MTGAPHRKEIYLRLGIADTLERSEDGKTWTDTHIGEATIYDTRPTKTWADLFQELSDISELEDIEASLPDLRQRRIGRLLSRALFGREGWVSERRWLHIIPVELPEDQARRDRFLDLVLRLPWSMTVDCDADDSEFLARRSIDPVSITIDAAPHRRDAEWSADVRLPPQPDVLLIIPQEEVGQPTCGRDHLEKLKAALKPHYGSSLDTKVRHVTTLRDMEILIGGPRTDGATPAFNPHIFYFYGHAETEGPNTKLQFDPEPEGDRSWVSVGEIRHVLKALTQRTQFPPVVWINGCKSGAAENENAVRSFAPIASTVIATRTLSAVVDSRALGESVLPKIAVDGRAPHSALRDAISRLTAETVRSARWATTIVAVQYELWTALDTERRGFVDLESGGDIPVRLDRISPLETIRTSLARAVTEGAQRPNFVVWRGPAEQGIEAFERRFVDLMLERFPDWSAVLRRVELQLSAKASKAPSERGLDAHYSASLMNAISGARHRAANDAYVDPQRIRTQIAELLRAPRSILVLSHGPFEKAQQPLLLDYIAFWTALYPLLGLDPTEQCVVVGIGFRDDTQDAFGAEGAVEVLLGAVDARGLQAHLQDYRLLYGLDPATEPERLLDESAGAFRPIYRTLSNRLRINQWKRLRDRDE